MFTQGVAALGQEVQRQIIEALRRYDDFDADNDPYGEHDFGAPEPPDWLRMASQSATLWAHPL